MDIFQFVDRVKPEPCLMNDELYLEKRRWFRWDQIQSLPLDVAYLKAVFGDYISLSVHFVGKIVVKAGVSAKGKSFVWCAEQTMVSRTPSQSVCEIDLSKMTQGNLEIFLLALEDSAVFDGKPTASALTVNPEHILYSFLFPTYDLCCEEPLYHKLSGEGSYYSFKDGNVHLEEDSSVDLLTYFNAFSAIKWKKYTNINSLSLYVDFEGEAWAELVHLSEEGLRSLASWKLLAPERTTLELPLGIYPNTGILGLRIHTERPSILHGGGWLSDAPETQPVRLGIGITTYRREGHVWARPLLNILCIMTPLPSRSLITGKHWCLVMSLLQPLFQTGISVNGWLYA